MTFGIEMSQTESQLNRVKSGPHLSNNDTYYYKDSSIPEIKMTRIMESLQSYCCLEQWQEHVLSDFVCTGSCPNWPEPGGAN